MRLHRLKVDHFAALRSADVTFGRGLNVLHGPNDLGKSTLAEAIRLVLLLPHTSSAGDPYVPWAGGQTPTVELTFETEAQRVWRVRKVFGKGGSSVLQSSRNGVEFDDVARARQVDAELRRILDWGIPEPGGSGAGRGLPQSFLATVLLSTQSDVTNLLASSLDGDGLASGRERVAAALQAVAQDPLFVKVLAGVQDRWDEAFTDSGARKTARGSVFKVAADRLAEARAAKEVLEKQVADTAAVEVELRTLAERRSEADAVAEAAKAEHAAWVARAKQAEERAASMGVVEAARARVLAIRKGHEAAAAGARRVLELEAQQRADEQAVAASEAELTRAEEARAAAEAVEGGADAAMAETIERQQLGLRAAAAETRKTEAERRLEALGVAAAAIAGAAAAGEAAREAGVAAEQAEAAAGQADGSVEARKAALEACDAVDRALERRAAEEALATARKRAAEAATLTDRLARARAEHGEIERSLALRVVPSSVSALRALERELVGARGALAVGLVVTVSPVGPLALGISRDGSDAETRDVSEAVDIEGAAAIDLTVGPYATVRVRGGRREAQQRVAGLEARWAAEVAPHLQRAGVADLDALDARIGEVRELEAQRKAKAAEIAADEKRLAELSDAEEALRVAEAAALPEGVGVDLAGVTPETARRRRAEATTALDRQRDAAAKARQGAVLARQVAEQRAEAARIAEAQRDAATAPYPRGVDAVRVEAEEARAAAERELRAVGASVAALDAQTAARAAQADQKVLAARSALTAAKERLEKARGAAAKRVGELQFAVSERDRLAAVAAAEDLAAAEQALTEAAARLEALPEVVGVGADALARAQRAVDAALADLDAIERALLMTRGRLTQVGGAVARERLQAAAEAFDLAEEAEQEIEKDYDAWKLLREALTEADRAQASNLGKALGPSVSSRFGGLTTQRYDRVQLDATLGTEGVVVNGAVRDVDRLSVGTREQLSTLYRLALAECLGSAVVLDDQLVQSDGVRMEWFRSVLREKADAFQIIVLTCRPSDYVDGGADGVTVVDLAACTRRS